MRETHRHLVGDHERGVEADAELADQLGPLLDVGLLQALQEARVPDLAMVPRFSTIAPRDMPTPLSEMVSVPAFAVGDELDLPVLVAFQQLLRGAATRSASLLMASLALLISSRRKMSLWE